jgi:hypothetical protein
LGGIVAAQFGRNTVFVLNSLSFVMYSKHEVRGTACPCRSVSVEENPFAKYRKQHPVGAHASQPGLHEDGRAQSGALPDIRDAFADRREIRKLFPIHREGFSARQSGMLGMSVLMAARGLGAFVGPLLAGKWAGGSLSRRGGYLALSVSTNIGVASAALVLAHSGGSMLWVLSSTLLQIQTEDRFRGPGLLGRVSRSA